MINSTYKLFLQSVSLLSVILSQPFVQAVPYHAKQVPVDSFFVLSLKGKKIITDSAIKDSLTWAPIINEWSKSNPTFQEFFIDPNSSGLNYNQPIHLFTNLQGTKNPDIIIGLIATVRQQTLVDSSLHSIAESLSVSKKPSPFPRFGNDKLPYEFGRKGRFVYFVAAIKRSTDRSPIPNDVYLDQIIENLLSKQTDNKAPATLGKHFTKLKDISVYIDGTGLAQLAETFWPSNQWQNAVPLIESMTNRSMGIYGQASKGQLKVEFKNLIDLNKTNQISSPPSSSIDLIPGDSPLIARFNFDSLKLKKIGGQWFEQLIQTFSGGQINLAFKIPGFNLSARDIFDAPSGEMILGLGKFNTTVIPPNERMPSGEVQLNPAFLGGIGIKNKEILRKLSIGLENSNVIGSILRMRGIEVTEKDNHIWFSSPEYTREIRMGKTLRPIYEGRKKFLCSHNIALDLRVLPLTQTVRKNRMLPYDYYKTLDWIEHIANLRVYSKDNTITATFGMHDKKVSPFSIIMDFLGQEIIDRKNSTLYQAIAQNDFQGLQQAVKMGALINANDHFGHSPLHYAAYKGNAGFVDYLLRNGGDPNAQSKHLSTPLHSAAWGRNLKVAEILLEDGADVNAKTDEGETPAMTAALRGEKDLLEILFSLSADPHAKDMHGSNLYDLAAAGGHLDILKILDSLKVKNNHPFHAAAGKGDLKAIKKMLKNGRSINERDAFGATPLIIATVSGKVDIVNFLLSKKADPKIEAKDGYTMMHAAAFSGKKELVQLAYELGLNINARYGKDGVTPVDVGEDASEAMPFMQSLGGRRGWELGRIPAN